MQDKELKPKIKEFTKKYFAYNQNGKLSAEIKQELEKLGAFKPYYSYGKDDRAIRFANMLESNNEEIKNIVLTEIKKDFSTSNNDETNILLDKIATYQNNMKIRMQKMKEAKEKKKYE
jgi:hypothetical protein